MKVIQNIVSQKSEVFTGIYQNCHIEAFTEPQRNHYMSLCPSPSGWIMKYTPRKIPQPFLIVTLKKERLFLTPGEREWSLRICYMVGGGG